MPRYKSTLTSFFSVCFVFRFYILFTPVLHCRFVKKLNENIYVYWMVDGYNGMLLLLLLLLLVMDGHDVFGFRYTFNFFLILLIRKWCIATVRCVSILLYCVYVVSMFFFSFFLSFYIYILLVRFCEVVVYFVHNHFFHRRCSCFFSKSSVCKYAYAGWMGDGFVCLFNFLLAWQK